MIDFTNDGPFADKADQLFPDRVRILGLGQTGAAVCDQLVLHGRQAQDLWVFDSDQLTIEGSVAPNRHLLGRDLVHGLGCSGDIELAREIVALEENALAHVTRGCDFLMLVLGLAGSTGMALAERLIELGHEVGAKVVVIGVQPFAFEGLARRERSIAAIADLRREADSVLVLSHDRIAEHAATIKNVRHGFHLMHQMMAKTVQALAQVVCKRGLIQLSFADVRSLYGRYTGSEVLENCWVAHFDGDIHDHPEDLVSQLLACPLLNDESMWKQVDHAIVAVGGTRDLGLSDVQEIVSAFKERIPVNIPIATSASLDEESNDKVRMTVLLAMTTPVQISAAETLAAVQQPKLRKQRPLASTAPIAVTPAKAQIEPPLTELPKTKPLRTPNAPSKPKPAPEPVSVEVPVEEEELLPSLAAEPELAMPLPLSTAPNSTRTSRRFVAKQEEMEFEGPARGRFEKTLETMYNGENLDQPTYRRRGLKIRL